MDSEPLKLVTAEPPSFDAVARLEEALVIAKRGGMSSVAIAWVDREGVITTGWSKPPSMGLLVGAVAALMHKLNTSWR